MNKTTTAKFIARRVLKLAFEARTNPKTARAAYAYMALARRWACKNARADLAALIRDAEESVLGWGKAA